MGIAAVIVALILVAVQLIPWQAVVLSLPFLYLVIAKPVLRRLAVRNAVRRPREALLIIVGALLGTAIITSAFVVGDTITSSIDRSAYTQLGPVDEAVLADGPQAGARVAAAVNSVRLKGVDGTLSLLVDQGAVASGGGTTARAEPQAQLIETDFAQARTFGGKADETGISGSTPTGDQAVIGTDLAHTLDVKVGDPVTVYLYGTSRTFTVVRVLPRLGVAGLASFANTSSTSPNLFLPPGTLISMQQAGPTGARSPPPISILAVSNVGSVTGGAKLTTQVHDELVTALHGMPSQVQDVKQGLINAAAAVGKGLSSLFQNFGIFSIAVGVLLLINIFVMLAQERKQTLGMLRAVGLRRSSLVGSFALEGWIYAVMSALAGMLVGIGIGRLVITVASRIFNQAGGGKNTLNLVFSVTRRSLQGGFVIGFVIALVTVLCTSLYIARLNVIRAIRDLPEPPSSGKLKSRLVFGILFTLVGVIVTAFAGSNGVAAIVGPAILGFGVMLLLLGRTPIRPTVSIVSLAVIVWSVVVFGVLGHAFRKSGFGVFVAQGLVLNIYAVLLITFNQQSIGAVIRTIGGGARNMSLRLGLANPLAKRFRTGLLLAMYAIVVFVLVLLTTISHFFGGQVSSEIAKIGGGASIIVDSNPAEPVPLSGIQQLSSQVTSVAATSGVTAQYSLGTSTTFRDYQTVGYDDSFIGHGAPNLHEWAGQYATQADVYRAAASDPTKIIVGQTFGTLGFGGPGPAPAALGDKVTLRDAVTGSTTQLTIIGLVDTSRYDGVDHVYVARSLSDRIFGSGSVSDLLFVSTASGTNNDELATAISGRYVSDGADATSFNKLVNDQNSTTNQFLTLIQGYVALGLLVGVAGLGVVMVRAVRERRREVGVLRALGFSAVAVRRAFLAESSFIALEGIGIGTILALITAWRLVDSGNLGGGVGFTVPWVPVIVLVVATFIASLLATAAPAIQASRIRPAVALRIAD